MKSSEDHDRGWYLANACDHAHCPLFCQKPQPCLSEDGRMLCMKCLVLDGVESVMIPCTPETCDEDA